MFHRLKDWLQLSLRTFRCPKTFLATAHLAATLIRFLSVYALGRIDIHHIQIMAAARKRKLAK